MLLSLCACFVGATFEVAISHLYDGQYKTFCLQDQLLHVCPVRMTCLLSASVLSHVTSHLPSGCSSITHAFTASPPTGDPQTDEPPHQHSAARRAASLRGWASRGCVRCVVGGSRCGAPQFLGWQLRGGRLEKIVLSSCTHAGPARVANTMARGGGKAKNDSELVRTIMKEGGEGGRICQARGVEPSIAAKQTRCDVPTVITSVMAPHPSAARP